MSLPQPVDSLAERDSGVLLSAQTITSETISTTTTTQITKVCSVCLCVSVFISVCAVYVCIQYVYIACFT